MTYKLRLLVLVFLAGLLAACQQDEVIEEVVLITETAVSPTIPYPTTTYTPTPSPTQTAVPTKLPTATDTATTIPTLTPLPTFAPDELETAVADLLADPMNCVVPCWWGAIPGITSLNEIKHTVSPYNFDINEYVDGQLTILRLGIGHVEERNDFEVRIGYGFTNSILTSVSAYSLPISELLVKYGSPDEIWLSTISFEREDLPVRLNLVYLQKGMTVGYVVDGDIRDDMIMGCFADKETGRLRLLVPDTATSYKDFTPIFELDRRYLPLEEASSLTMAEFMQQFSDPTQPQCLETPTELWD